MHATLLLLRSCGTCRQRYSWRSAASHLHGRLFSRLLRWNSAGAFLLQRPFELSEAACMVCQAPELRATACNEHSQQLQLLLLSYR